MGFMKFMIKFQRTLDNKNALENKVENKQQSKNKNMYWLGEQLFLIRSFGTIIFFLSKNDV